MQSRMAATNLRHNNLNSASVHWLLNHFFLLQRQYNCSCYLAWNGKKVYVDSSLKWCHLIHLDRRPERNISRGANVGTYQMQVLDQFDYKCMYGRRVHKMC